MQAHRLRAWSIVGIVQQGETSLATERSLVQQLRAQLRAASQRAEDAEGRESREAQACLQKGFVIWLVDGKRSVTV